MPKQVPPTVAHSDFVTAITPLLDLLGVTADDVYMDIHIASVPQSAPAFARISMAVAAGKADDDRGRPAGVSLADAPQEHAELAYTVYTDVI